MIQPVVNPACPTVIIVLPGVDIDAVQAQADHLRVALGHCNVLFLGGPVGTQVIVVPPAGDIQ